MDEQRKERLTTTDMASAGREARAETHAPPQHAGEAPGGDRPGGTAVSDQTEKAPLFSPDEAQRFRSRWDSIQAGFVDEPRRAVEQADGLVADSMKRLAEVFSDERENLERQWGRGSDVSTEDLRVALQRYRSFFDRLLSV